MARTTMEIPYDCSFDEAQAKVEHILRSAGFKEKMTSSGESVWKKGANIMTSGLVTGGMRFIKVEYSQDCITISAWVQMGVGNMGGGEMDLTGFLCGSSKKSLLNVLEAIKNSF